MTTEYDTEITHGLENHCYCGERPECGTPEQAEAQVLVQFAAIEATMRPAPRSEAAAPWPAGFHVDMGTLEVVPDLVPPARPPVVIASTLLDLVTPLELSRLGRRGRLRRVDVSARCRALLGCDVHELNHAGAAWLLANL